MVNSIVQKYRERSKGRTVEVEDPETKQKDVWTIRPLSTTELAEHSELFESIPDNQQDDDKTRMVLARKVLIPLMKVVLPSCCISPKVTLDENDPRLKDPNSDVLLFTEIPVPVGSELLEKILDASGLTKRAEESRKN